jgi:Glycosyl hydrolase family 57
MGRGGLTLTPSPAAGAAPRLVCLFHLNLAFSSLEEEARATVVERCYWPVLRLPAQTGFPVAIELTGWTLEQIAALDPAWIAEARRMLAAGTLELVGSGHAQCIGPLLPAEVNAWNLRLGLEDYERLLGVRPRIALVNEQAYAPGLVALYAEAGFAALIADWENAHRSHADWPAARRRLPQRALGTGGASLPVIFSESLVFQRFQRFAHGTMEVAEWVTWVEARALPGPAGLLVYANDAEVFDHRPGRFAAEPPPGEGEWARIAEGLSALAARAETDPAAGRPALPSELLGLLDAEGAGQPLALESAAHPIPVKKQDKYNVVRWAVSGRDDVGLNTACARLLSALRRSGSEDPAAWRALVELWASDLRTHITASRWERAQAALAEAVSRLGATAPPPRPPAPAAADDDPLPAGVTRARQAFTVTAGPLTVVLDAARGLAITAFTDARVAEQPLFGTIPHGYYEAIDLGADWYSGNLVQEPPGRHKVADLSPAAVAWAATGGGGVRAWATVDTPLGPIEKVLTIDPEHGLELDVTLRWTALPDGSLRGGNVTLNPEAFDAGTLAYATHNGGRDLERHRLGAEAVDHGHAVSTLVSAGQALGITEGVVVFGDGRRHLRVAVDREVAAPIGLVTYRPLPGTFFARLTLSLAEHDDTRRGPIPRAPDAPQRLRLRVSAVGGPVPGG